MASATAPIDASTQQWMEIFYSKPSMHRCFLLERLPSGNFASPSADNELVDASHIRANFRVLRRAAGAPFEFILTDGSDRIRDDNHGDHYHVDGTSGRYVVENGVRRVGDADAAECFQSVMRPTDRFVHLCFAADLWDACYVSFQRPDTAWTPAPGEQMTRVKAGDGARFEIIIEARRLSFAFNDGNDVWDANNGDNYTVGGPGKYCVVDGRPQYVGPSDRDLAEDPTGKAVRKPSAANPAAEPAAAVRASPIAGTAARSVSAQ